MASAGNHASCTRLPDAFDDSHSAAKMDQWRFPGWIGVEWAGSGSAAQNASASPTAAESVSARASGAGRARVRRQYRHGAGQRRVGLGDLFDRMLVAQSQMEDLTVVSNDTVFDAYGAVRIW